MDKDMSKDEQKFHEAFLKLVEVSVTLGIKNKKEVGTLFVSEWPSVGLTCRKCGATPYVLLAADDTNRTKKTVMMVVCPTCGRAVSLYDALKAGLKNTVSDVFGIATKDDFIKQMQDVLKSEGKSCECHKHTDSVKKSTHKDTDTEEPSPSDPEGFENEKTIIKIPVPSGAVLVTKISGGVTLIRDGEE